MEQNNILEIEKFNFDKQIRKTGFDLKVKKASIHSVLFQKDQFKKQLLDFLSAKNFKTDANLIYKDKNLENKDIKNLFQKSIYLINQYSAVNPQKDLMEIFKFNKKEPQENRSTIFPEMTIAENIFLGREPQKKYLFFKVIDKQKMTKKTEDLLKMLEVELYPEQKMFELSPLEKQLIEMLKGLSLGAEIILIDQALIELAYREKQIFFNFMQKLKEKGLTFIYFTKEIDEVFAVCDFVSVLKAGENNTVRRVSELEYNELALLLMGR
jgi:ABC-type sugar transport system ATPase subunit